MTDSPQSTEGLGELFSKEDLIAFFEFLYHQDHREPAHGLCKISKPKKGESNLNYISLVFVLDVSDPGTIKRFETIVSKLSKYNLRRCLNHVESTMIVPAMTSNPVFSIREVEIVFGSQRTLDHEFILDWLYPTILSLTGFKSEPLVWCSEFEEQVSTAPRGIPIEKQSIMQRIAKFFESSD